MIKEIGSNFWEYSINTNNSDNVRLWFENDGFYSYYFKSGRNAIKAICQIEDYSNKRALVPAYTCSTVIDPFLDSGWIVDYFDIQNDLTVDVTDFLHKIESFQPSLILFHAFFGLDTLSNIRSLAKQLRREGIIVVEDRTQAFMAGFDTIEADYYVSSLRKFFAIPDGGVLLTKKQINENVIEAADPEITNVAFEAFEKKRQYLFEESNVTKEEFRELYMHLQTLISDNSCLKQISKSSLDILKCINRDTISRNRRNNYNALHELGVMPLKAIKGKADEKSAPLYYPTYAQNGNHRKMIQSELAKRGIYCPIIWPKPVPIDTTDKNVEKIYQRILCIPVDQRYDENDMGLIVKVLQEVKNNER